MINLRFIPGETSLTQLGVQFRDLDLTQNEYEGFRVKIKDRDWVYGSTTDSKDNKSEIIIIDNLEGYMRYKVFGEYKTEGVWHEIEPMTFVTYDGLGYKDNPELNSKKNFNDYIKKLKISHIPKKRNKSKTHPPSRKEGIRYGVPISLFPMSSSYNTYYISPSSSWHSLSGNDAEVSIVIKGLDKLPNLESFYLYYKIENGVNSGDWDSIEYHKNLISPTIVIALNIFKRGQVIRFQVLPNSLEEEFEWSWPYIIETITHTGNYRLNYSPVVTHQWHYEPSTGEYIGGTGSCVANAICTRKEIHEYLEGKGYYNRYSISWVYGNQIEDISGMDHEEAFNNLMVDGVPLYDTMIENYSEYQGNWQYPDGRVIIDTTDSYGRPVKGAKTIFNVNKNRVKNDAKLQVIDDWIEYSEFIFNSDIKSYIQSDGAITMYLGSSDEFHDTGTDGIVSDIILPYSSYSGHHMVVLGWKKISNKDYWICQNSWGTNRGDNGIFYVPFNYGGIWGFFRLFDKKVNVTTVPITPSKPIVTDIDTNSISIVWSRCQTASSYTVSYKKYTSSTWVNLNTNNTYITLSGLSGNTTYQFRVYAKNSFGNSGISPSDSATTTSDKPDDWVWETNFEQLYSVAHSSILGNYIYIMPPDEWNRFLARVREFRIYTGTGTITFPTYSKDTEFTADVYNIAVNAINPMKGYFTGEYKNKAVPMKNIGDELKSSDFDLMQKSLKSIL